MFSSSGVLGNAYNTFLSGIQRECETGRRSLTSAGKATRRSQSQHKVQENIIRKKSIDINRCLKSESYNKENLYPKKKHPSTNFYKIIDSVAKIKKDDFNKKTMKYENRQNHSDSYRLDYLQNQEFHSSEPIEISKLVEPPRMASVRALRPQRSKNIEKAKTNPIYEKISVIKKKHVIQKQSLYEPVYKLAQEHFSEFRNMLNNADKTIRNVNLRRSLRYDEYDDTSSTSTFRLVNIPKTQFIHVSTNKSEQPKVTKIESFRSCTTPIAKANDIKSRLKQIKQKTKHSNQLYNLTYEKSDFISITSSYINQGSQTVNIELSDTTSECDENIGSFNFMQYKRNPSNFISNIPKYVKKF